MVSKKFKEGTIVYYGPKPTKETTGIVCEYKKVIERDKRINEGGIDELRVWAEWGSHYSVGWMPKKDVRTVESYNRSIV